MRDDRLGDVGQLAVVGTGVGAQPFECLVHPETVALGDGAFGLLDDDPAVQRALQLRGQPVSVARRRVLQQRDGGGMGKRLRDATSASDNSPGSAMNKLRVPSTVSRSRIGKA